MKFYRKNVFHYFWYLNWLENSWVLERKLKMKCPLTLLFWNGLEIHGVRFLLQRTYVRRLNGKIKLKHFCKKKRKEEKVCENTILYTSIIRIVLSSGKRFSFVCEKIVITFVWLILRLRIYSILQTNKVHRRRSSARMPRCWSKFIFCLFSAFYCDYFVLILILKISSMGSFFVPDQIGITLSVINPQIPYSINYKPGVSIFSTYPKRVCYCVCIALQGGFILQGV